MYVTPWVSNLIEYFEAFSSRFEHVWAFPTISKYETPQIVSIFSRGLCFACVDVTLAFTSYSWLLVDLSWRSWLKLGERSLLTQGWTRTTALLIWNDLRPQQGKIGKQAFHNADDVSCLCCEYSFLFGSSKQFPLSRDSRSFNCSLLFYSVTPHSVAIPKSGKSEKSCFQFFWDLQFATYRCLSRVPCRSFSELFFQVISIVFSEQFTSAKDPEISRSLEAKIHPL